MEKPPSALAFGGFIATGLANDYLDSSSKIVWLIA